jgi:CheY-like chemotaxis protein/anti-sigma regulatory factor (Ser/Thr protein kinase)
VNLQRVLRTALRVASSHIDGRAQVIEQYEDVPPVEGSAARLEQVFLNLFVNAAQALPPETALTNQIRVSLRAIGEKRVTVEVHDNGFGIPPELIDRVFDPFFTTKPTGVGTGLGLPICQSIVKSLGGEIGVESSPGEGTVFRVTLPAQPRATKLLTPTPMPAPVEPGRARVLVVDDELALASMLQRVLEDEHEVHVRTTAHEALELLTSGEEFDVVLCDLLMPAMSGMDLYRELKRYRPGLEDRMVFMTGGAFTPRAAEFLGLVSNRRIEKPFDLSQVRRLVRELASPDASQVARGAELFETR